MRAWLISILALFAAGAAQAGEQLERGPPPAWVRAPEAAPAADPIQDLSAFRVDLMEQQFRFDDAGLSIYMRTRMTVLTPQALTPLGTVAVAWNPAHQTVTIHAVNILRGDQTIDALAGQEFSVLRREENLEAAVLDGLLTGTFQLNGLRVGDTLEFAYTLRSKVPLLGPHAEFLTGATLPAPVGRFYLRGTWPTDRNLRIRASDGWETPPVRRRGRESEIEIDMQGLEPLLVPLDAPMRFRHVRQLEGTDYQSWGDVAALFAPLFEEASTLAPDSPLRERVAEIRASAATPAERAAAALRLVQDEVRYLALAMDDGGLVPASADETWRRRLGDCKGKTALLLALLRELDIPARAVLVSTEDDALDKRLPMVAVFDHVIVQAEIDGRVVWLDGARTGDRAIADIAPPEFGWVLPLRRADARLEHVELVPPTRPQRETTIAFDASQGLYTAVPVTGEQRLYGDSATVLQLQMAAVAPAQRDAYMRQLWTGLVDDLEIGQLRSAYDADQNVLRLTMAGSAKLSWTAGGVRRLEMPLTRISWSAGEPRPAGPYRDLPVLTGYPFFSRFVTTVKLPDGGRGFTLSGEDVDEEAAAHHYVRRATIEDGVATVWRETRTLRPEMTVAEQAAAVAPLERLKRLRVEVAAPSDYEASAEDLNALETDAPATAEALLEQGLALSDNGLAEEAIAAFDRAIALEPDYALAWSNRGIVRFWRDEIDAALADFDRAAELDPSDRVAMNGHGLVAMKRERFEDAVLAFSRSLREEPDDTFVLGARSAAYLGLRDHDNALADARRLATLRPDASGPALHEIRILIMAGRVEEAAARADELAARHPAELAVRQAQADAKVRLKAYAAAEAVYDAALSIDGEDDHPMLLLGRAEVRARQGRLDQARADLARVRPVAKDSGGLLNNLCWIQAIVGLDLEQALADCDAALALSPDTAAYLDSRALVLLQLGRPAEALEAYEKALADTPEQWASLYGRGLARQALGQTEAGQADLDAAVAGDPKVADSFQAYVDRARTQAAAA